MNLVLGKNKKITPKSVIKYIKDCFVPRNDKKMASDLHRTAQPLTLAMFPSWGILQELVV
jgi:hypothetical protein